jgi:hypothetical protein
MTVTPKVVKYDCRVEPPFLPGNRSAVVRFAEVN